MKTNRGELLSMVFKIEFLKTMLSEMSAKDASFYSGFVIKSVSGTITEEDVSKLEELYRRFERKPDASDKIPSL
jgi:hypothetical protein